MSTFSGLLVGLAGPVVKKALLSLGVGIVTYAGVQAAVSTAISASQNAMGGMASAPAAILSIAGVFTSMSIIAGGITAAVTMIALKKLQILTG